MAILLMSLVVTTVILSLPVGFWLRWSLGNRHLSDRKIFRIERLSTRRESLTPQRQFKTK